MSVIDDLWRMVFARTRVDHETVVRRTSRDEHEVQIGDRYFRVETEMGHGAFDFVISPSSVREYPPPADPLRLGFEVSNEESCIVVEKLRAYFDRNRYRYQVGYDVVGYNVD